MSAARSKLEARSWSGRFVLAPGRLLFVGHAGAATTHAHVAFQVVIGLERDFDVTLGSRTLRRRACLIKSNAPHALDARGQRIAVLLVESMSPSTHRLAAELHGRELATTLREFDAPALDAPARTLSAWADARLSELGANTTSEIVSGPTRRALRSIDDELRGMPRLTSAANRAQLSPSRLSHLFRREVGIPFRRFILWARLRRAAHVATTGGSATECALEAGFSDSAHFTRTFRRHFGLTPSTVLPLIQTDWPFS